MTGPEVRARMDELSTVLGQLAISLNKPFVGRPERRLVAKRMTDISLEIAWLSLELRRRPPVRRAPRQSRKMTSELSDKIADYATQHPDLAMHRIGRQFGVNGGRVSEAVAGKRT